MKNDAPPRLAVPLCGLTLQNPVIAASGTFGYGVEFAGLVELDRLGGLVVKGLSREPMPGNPEPRLYETASGMLNSVGLQNIGVRVFVQEKLPSLAGLRAAVFANVFGHQVDDYVEVIRVLEDAAGLAGYELNVSCPNTRRGGQQFGAEPGLLEEVVGAAKGAVRSGRPLMVKLSPNVGDIAALARAAEQAGADAVSLVNTFSGLAIDARRRRPRLGAGFGGLSGPAIKPVALAMVCRASRAVRIPVVGLGGVASGEEVAEFLLAGATAVQVGTAAFWDPQAPARIAGEFDRFLRREGIAAARDLIGGLEMNSSG